MEQFEIVDHAAEAAELPELEIVIGSDKFVDPIVHVPDETVALQWCDRLECVLALFACLEHGAIDGGLCCDASFDERPQFLDRL